MNLFNAHIIGRITDLRFYFAKSLLDTIWGYSSVPNSRVGQNKHAGGKILRKH